MLAAIASLLSPRATSSTLSYSRTVRRSRSTARSGGADAVTNSLINVWMTTGDSSASPRATTMTTRSRSAGATYLSMYPLASPQRGARAEQQAAGSRIAPSGLHGFTGQQLWAAWDSNPEPKD